MSWAKPVAETTTDKTAIVIAKQKFFILPHESHGKRATFVVEFWMLSGLRIHYP